MVVGVTGDTAEHRRIAAADAGTAAWRRWGTYLADRAWGTVREDYSATGDAWRAVPHDHARSRAYRWNEDGLAGWCDDGQRLCLAIALWNERDSILKERLFGLTGHEGNHGEDVKEYWFHEDGVPTHSYARMTYRYPHAAFPYADLVAENARRDRFALEYELHDALASEFAAHRFTDVTVEYAKADVDDVVCRITAVNHGPEPVPLHVLPHLWARNTWRWQLDGVPVRIHAAGPGAAVVAHPRIGAMHWWVLGPDGGTPQLLWTENESNDRRLYGAANVTAHVKDGINDRVVHGDADAVSPHGEGSKVAAWSRLRLAPGEPSVVWMRLATTDHADPFADAAEIVAARRDEADAFHDTVAHPALTPEERHVHRAALAGLEWTKQWYHYDVEDWLQGDPGHPAPPEARRSGRNADWWHLNNADVLSMPDGWEYPWYAAWDLAFHMVPLALTDPGWAKEQLLLLLREWYQHPNGQLPAYEWAFGDVNPPVHAWACRKVFEIERDTTGRADHEFLERAFHKLLLNFTWWVNRKDPEGNNVFAGGFLGLDNIGVFDRSRPLSGGLKLEQADGTAWMGMYCLDMLAIALELASHDHTYADVATKFFEHFMYIARSINSGVGHGGLWHPDEEFYFDALRRPEGGSIPIATRSFVGLVPLFAVHTIAPEVLDALPEFRARMRWFLTNKPHVVDNVASLVAVGDNGHTMLSLVGGDRLATVLGHVLDPGEFLSPHGLRSLSREHLDDPYVLHVDGRSAEVRYEPAESTTPLFGGNSNWRGPVWFPVNYLLIEALRRHAGFEGTDRTVECPTGSGNRVPVGRVAAQLAERLTALFLPGDDGTRPFWGELPLRDDPLWRDRLLFHEYFHGDIGAGLGASHQTGWTALVATLLQELAAGR